MRGLGVRSSLGQRSIPGTSGAAPSLAWRRVPGEIGVEGENARPRPQVCLPLPPSVHSFCLLHPPCVSCVGEPPPAPTVPSAFLQYLCPERAGSCLSPPNPAWGLREPLLHLAVLPGQGESSSGRVTGLLRATLDWDSGPQA